MILKILTTKISKYFYTLYSVVHYFHSKELYEDLIAQMNFHPS